MLHWEGLDFQEACLESMECKDIDDVTWEPKALHAPIMISWKWIVAATPMLWESQMHASILLLRTIRTKFLVLRLHRVLGYQWQLHLA